MIAATMALNSKHIALASHDAMTIVEPSSPMVEGASAAGAAACGCDRSWETVSKSADNTAAVASKLALVEM